MHSLATTCGEIFCLGHAKQPGNLPIRGHPLTAFTAPVGCVQAHKGGVLRVLSTHVPWSVLVKLRTESRTIEATWVCDIPHIFRILSLAAIPALEGSVGLV